MARVQHARPLRIALVTEYYYPHLGGICEHVHFFAREARRSATTSTSSRRTFRAPARSRMSSGSATASRFTPTGRRPGSPGDSSYGRTCVVCSVSDSTTSSTSIRRSVRSLPVLAIEEADCPVVGTFHTYFDRSFFYDRRQPVLPEATRPAARGDRRVALDDDSTQSILRGELDDRSQRNRYRRLQPARSPPRRVSAPTSR